MQRNSLSILLFGTQLATGGAQKVLLDQGRWFHERGHKIVALFVYDKENLHDKWQKDAAFPIHVLVPYKSGMKKPGILFKALASSWNLWKFLRRGNFDVVEAFTHDSNMFILPLAWVARVPVRIATHHGIIEGFPRWRERLHAWMVNNDIAHKIVAVSEMTRQISMTEGIRAERITVIQNGIAPIYLEGEHRLQVRKEAGIGANDFFLLSVGRLVYQKAHAILVAAMPAVLLEFPDTKAGICGEGVLRRELEMQIKTLGLESSVKLLGKWENVARFLSSADVFVLPSRWEGLPIALLEAMSVGLPVIATNVEGVDEVIVEGVHGLLVPVEDPPSLAQAILQLLREPQMRSRMGTASKQRLRDLYSADRMCEKYLMLMNELLPQT